MCSQIRFTHLFLCTLLFTHKIYLAGLGDGDMDCVEKLLDFALAKHPDVSAHTIDAIRSDKIISW